MRIAISSTGNSIEDDIDERFGRCPYFLIIDIKDKKVKNVKSIENIAKAQMGGAGIKASEIVASEKVGAIITTNLGPKALSVFEQFNIKIYQGKGKINDAIKKFINGELKEITELTGKKRSCF